MGDYKFYDELWPYLVQERELESYGYPCRDPNDSSLRKLPSNITGQLRPQFASNYTCCRCRKTYQVDRIGVPVKTAGTCRYHNKTYLDYLEEYPCCAGSLYSQPCGSNLYHVHEGEQELANYQGYVETQDKPERDLNRHGAYGLDCEMCCTTYGLELTRVTLIDHKLNVVYDELAKPSSPILDYNTKFSGVKEGDLGAVSKRLDDVQCDLLELFSSKTILVGHGLDNDMKALKLFHKRFIDTVQLYPHKRGLPFKKALKGLVEEKLGFHIQSGNGHDSREDAVAAFQLVMQHARKYS